MPDANMLFRQAAPASIGAGATNALAGQANLNKFAMQPTANALLENQAAMAGEQVAAAKTTNAEATKKIMLRDAYLDGMEALEYLKRGDLQGFHAATAARDKRITDRGGDPSDTRAFDAGIKDGTITVPDGIAKLMQGVARAKQELDLMAGPQKGTYGALTSAIGPDGKPVLIQGSPVGGAPNVLSGYQPMPTAQEQQVAREQQQAQALADVLTGGGQNTLNTQVDGVTTPRGMPPSPNVTGGQGANLTAAQIAALPPDIRAAIAKERLTSTGQAQTAAANQAQTKGQYEIDKLALESAEADKKRIAGLALKDEALGLVRDLLADKDAVKSVVGSSLDTGKFSPTFFPSSLEAINKIDRLIAILTKENLGVMSGVLTDTDMEFLQKLSGGQLNRSRDQDAYLSDLMTLEQSLGGSGTVQRAKIRVDF